MRSPEGVDVHLRWLHVRDLREDVVGILSSRTYESLSAAFDVIDGMSPEGRWRVMGDEAHMLNVYATDLDAVIGLAVRDVAGKVRFVACVRDMFGQGARAREWWRDEVGIANAKMEDVQWRSGQERSRGTGSILH